MQCFLHKHKDQASIPRTLIKVRCSAVASAPRAGEADAGGFLGLAGLPVKPNWFALTSGRDPVYKNKVER